MGRHVSRRPRLKKQQIFTQSGTFTPSPGLLAAGGVVTVRLVGGGGGGMPVREYYGGGSGGGSGADITRIVTVTAPVQVVVGAGGMAQGKGGDTKFGDLIAGGGLPGDSNMGGAAGGIGGTPGETGSWYGAGSQVNPSQKGATGGGAGGGTNSPAPNSGGGGSGYSNNNSGASGRVEVTWEE